MAFDDIQLGGAPVAKFVTVGDTVKLTLTDAEVRDETDMVTGIVKKYDDGNPKKQIVLTGIDNSDGDEKRIFVKGQMKFAVGQAVSKAGAGKLEANGTLTIRYTGDKPNDKVGLHAQKLFDALYEPPAQKLASLSDLA